MGLHTFSQAEVSRVQCRSDLPSVEHVSCFRQQVFKGLVKLAGLGLVPGKSKPPISPSFPNISKLKTNKNMSNKLKLQVRKQKMNEQE